MMTSHGLAVPPGTSMQSCCVSELIGCVPHQGACPLSKVPLMISSVAAVAGAGTTMSPTMTSNVVIFANMATHPWERFHRLAQIIRERSHDVNQLISSPKISPAQDLVI